MNRLFASILWRTWWICLLLVPPVHAGGGPLNTLVVVNRSSRNSRALGQYYAQKRGIPKPHLCSIKVDPRSSNISQSALERDIRLPIAKHIASQKLEGQIHYIVFSMDIPTRVDKFNGLTSVLFYGYKTPVPDAPRCNLAPDSANQFYMSETAYTSTRGWNQTNAPIPFFLIADTLQNAKALVDRSVAADSTFPSGLFCLYGTGDSARNIRHHTYAQTARQFQLHGMAGLVDTNPGADTPPDQPVLGWMTGRAYFPEHYENLHLAPGAIAEHLTSCAGMLPDPCNSQNTVLDWISRGASASYGTVSEPCSYREKFPDPLLHFWYARGFTAGEALAMSVRNPYQGIWVGDPLTAPFAAPPVAQILSPPPNAVITNGTPLRLAVTAHNRGAPPVFVDLYINGRHHAPVVRPIIPVGNELTAEIGTNRYTYTVAPGESLEAAVVGLAWAVNSKARGAITAKAVSDRLEITTRSPLDPDGNPLAFAVSSSAGFAPALYINGKARTSSLQVEAGTGRAAATFHLGTARTYNIEYPLPTTGLTAGTHTYTLVVRDGTAVQTQSQTSITCRVIPN